MTTSTTETIAETAPGRPLDEAPPATAAATLAEVEALARRAHQPALADRREGGWRLWSDGEVTADGRRPLHEVLPGARELGLRLPVEVSGGSYAWMTRRDATVVRDAVAGILGTSGVARRRALLVAGVPEPEDRLSWRFPGSVSRAASPVEEAAARLRTLVADPTAWSTLASAVRQLLTAWEFGAELPRSDRSTLEIYADACGATYGEPDVGEAICSLLAQVDAGGAWLDRVSVASEPVESERGSPVRVDLHALESACREAVYHRAADSSPPWVGVSADVLAAVASYARQAQDALSVLASARLADLAGVLPELALLAARGVVVDGPGAADACGSVVEPLQAQYARGPASPAPGDEGLVLAALVAAADWVTVLGSVLRALEVHASREEGRRELAREVAAAEVQLAQMLGPQGEELDGLGRAARAALQVAQGATRALGGAAETAEASSAAETGPRVGEVAG